MTHAPHEPADSGGYRPITGAGPRVRTDVVDVYVFRHATDADLRVRGGDRFEAGPDPSRRPIMFLQLLRCEPPLENTWHPVMGHIEPGETAVQCARRELREEIGLQTDGSACAGMWALEQVHPFFIASIDTIVMSPRFAAQVAEDFVPRLNREHSRFRWIHQEDVRGSFLWPGQVASCAEILGGIVPSRSLAREHLRLPL